MKIINFDHAREQPFIIELVNMQNLFHKICIFSVWKYGEGEGVVFNIF